MQKFPLPAVVWRKLISLYFPSKLARNKESKTTKLLLLPDIFRFMIIDFLFFISFSRQETTQAAVNSDEKIIERRAKL